MAAAVTSVVTGIVPVTGLIVRDSRLVKSRLTQMKQVKEVKLVIGRIDCSRHHWRFKKILFCQESVNTRMKSNGKASFSVSEAAEAATERKPGGGH